MYLLLLFYGDGVDQSAFPPPLRSRTLFTQDGLCHASLASIGSSVRDKI